MPDFFDLCFEFVEFFLQAFDFRGVVELLFRPGELLPKFVLLVAGGFDLFLLFFVERHRKSRFKTRDAFFRVPTGGRPTLFSPADRNTVKETSADRLQFRVCRVFVPFSRRSGIENRVLHRFSVRLMRLLNEDPSMSFLLCHDCYTWVEPVDDRCPECLFVMDLSESDPPPRLLRDVMGELVKPLGEVRIPRRLLPEVGILYATTEGLFFLPHEMDPSRTLEQDRSGVRAWLNKMKRVLWLPFSDSMSFRLDGNHELSAPAGERPARSLLAEEQPDLPRLLMENPGAFFLSKRQVAKISRKRKRWIIERCQGSRVQIVPLQPARMFFENFETLLESPAWQLASRSSVFEN